MYYRYTCAVDLGLCVCCFVGGGCALQSNAKQQRKRLTRARHVARHERHTVDDTHLCLARKRRTPGPPHYFTIRRLLPASQIDTADCLARSLQLIIVQTKTTFGRFISSKRDAETIFLVPTTSPPCSDTVAASLPALACAGFPSSPSASATELLLNILADASPEASTTFVLKYSKE